MKNNFNIIACTGRSELDERGLGMGHPGIIEEATGTAPLQGVPRAHHQVRSQGRLLA